MKNTIAYEYRNNCIVCNKKACSIIKLDNFPITEILISIDEITIRPELLIDQGLMYCQDCQHLFLNKVLDINFIYGNYMTTSSSSKGAEDCLIRFKDFILQNMEAKEVETIIDIGGNDSTFLNLFHSYGLTLINIDINASSKNNKNIILINEFVEKINLKPFIQNKKIIASSHTLEHLENPQIIIEEISKNTNENDYIFLQFPCLEQLIEYYRFDQICNQHLNYFSLNSIGILLSKYNLSIVKFEYDLKHFGTLRLMIRKGNFLYQFSENHYISLDLILDKYNKFTKYYRILNDITENKLNSGHGFGAGLMLPVLAYYFPVVNNLKYIYDDNKNKANKKYPNLNPIIQQFKDYDLNQPILITSVGTNLAARTIFKKLDCLGFQTIIIPTINL